MFHILKFLHIKILKKAICKFALSEGHPKARKLSASGGLCPLTRPWTPLGALPQTPVQVPVYFALNFDVWYVFLSILLVLENCNFRSLKVLEFCPFSLLWTLILVKCLAHYRAARIELQSNHYTGISCLSVEVSSICCIFRDRLIPV